MASFNVSKQFQFRASLPSKTGRYRDSQCVYDLIHAIQKDIHIFNYTYQVLQEKKEGHFLFSKVLSKGKGGKGERSYPVKTNIRNNSTVLLNFEIKEVALAFTDIKQKMAIYEE